MTVNNRVSEAHKLSLKTSGFCAARHDARVRRKVFTTFKICTDVLQKGCVSNGLIIGSRVRAGSLTTITNQICVVVGGGGASYGATSKHYPSNKLFLKQFCPNSLPKIYTDHFKMAHFPLFFLPQSQKPGWKVC